MPLDPLVLYINDNVKLWIYEKFEILPLNHYRIFLYPQGLHVAFPPGQGMALLAYKIFYYSYIIMMNTKINFELLQPMI